MINEKQPTAGVIIYIDINLAEETKRIANVFFKNWLEETKAFAKSFIKLVRRKESFCSGIYYIGRSYCMK